MDDEMREDLTDLENWDETVDNLTSKEESKKFEFYIAGVQHHDSYKCQDAMAVDDFLNMVLEPTNKFDPNAVRLEFRDTMIGYVPARISAEVSALVTDPENLWACKLIELNKDNKPWERFKVLIEEVS